MNSSPSPARTTAAGSIATYGRGEDLAGAELAAPAWCGARHRRGGPSGRARRSAPVAAPPWRRGVAASTRGDGLQPRRSSGPSMTVVPSVRSVGVPPDGTARGRRRGAPLAGVGGVRTTVVASWASGVLSERSSIVTGYMPASGSSALPPSTRCWGRRHRRQGDRVAAQPRRGSGGPTRWRRSRRRGCAAGCRAGVARSCRASASFVYASTTTSVLAGTVPFTVNVNDAVASGRDDQVLGDECSVGRRPAPAPAVGADDECRRAATSARDEGADELHAVPPRRPEHGEPFGLAGGTRGAGTARAPARCRVCVLTRALSAPRARSHRSPSTHERRARRPGPGRRDRRRGAARSPARRCARRRRTRRRGRRRRRRRGSGSTAWPGGRRRCRPTPRCQNGGKARASTAATVGQSPRRTRRSAGAPSGRRRHARSRAARAGAATPAAGSRHR